MRMTDVKIEIMKIFLKILSTLFLCAGIISCTGELDNGEQDGSHSIGFPENPVIVGYSSGTYQAAVISADEWTAEPVSEWIYDVARTAEGIEFTVEANGSEDFRDGSILFSVPGSSYTRSLTVRQSGNTGKLSVEKTDVDIATTGGTCTLSVSSSENWTVSSTSSMPWLTAEKQNSTTLSLSAEANYSGSPLSGTLTLTTVSGNESIDINVTQEADNSVFLGATTQAGRKFVHKSGLVTSVVSDKAYSLNEDTDVLEIQYMGNASGSVEPYSLFVFDIELSDRTSVAVTCTGNDASTIKTNDSEVTATSIVREKLAAMQADLAGHTVLGGVNGDFFYGAGSDPERNNLLHGVMHKDGICLKSTFDGGAACTVFAIMKDGTARILTQQQYAGESADIQEAVGGRQHLLSSGTPLDFTDERFEPRTVVGTGKDGHKVIIAVMDGRRDSYSVGASYEVMAEILLAMGAEDGINLDGGGSSTFAVKTGTGSSIDDFETLNRPTDTAGERAVVNGLAIISGE